MSEGLYFPQQTTSGVTLPIFDTQLILENASDPTKRALFSCANITTLTTRTYTFPDANMEFVGAAVGQTLTAKTIQGATLKTSTLSGSLVTEEAAPLSPASGKMAWYASTSHMLTTLDSNGNTIALDPAKQVKAWVNFAAVSQGASYSQSGTGVTVFATAHGMSSTGMYAALDFTSGLGTDNDGFYPITVVDANTFSFTATNSHSTTGAVTLSLFVRDSVNVTAVAYNALGDYTVFFANAFSNIYYSPTINASYVGGAVFKVASPFVTAGGTDTPPTTTNFRFALVNLSAAAVNSKYITVDVSGR